MIQVNKVTTLSPEVVLDRANLSKESRGVASGLYGPDVLHHDGLVAGSSLIWDVTVNGGEYDLWAKYAAGDPRPMQLHVDRSRAAGAALRDATGGWAETHQSWLFQRRLTVASGSHSISLTSEGAPPHVAALALVPVRDGSPPPGLDVDAAEALWTSSLAQQPAPIASELDGPTRHLALALRQALNAGAERADLIELVTGLTDAIAGDIANPQTRLGFSGPLNGQRIRQRLFLELKQLMRFDAVVETGAYHGTTTEWFASLDLPVYSCEVMPEQYYYTAARLAEYPDAHFYHSDSRSFLKKYFAEHHVLYSRPAFYLDAHWADDLPLPEEVDIIADNSDEFLIVVDDFKSPFHDYGYDQYSNGNELTLEFLLPRLKTKRKLVYLFPAFGPEAETGARRGTLFITTQEAYDRSVKSIGSLLRAA